MPVDLQGQIERITYANEENGFTIARLRVQGRHDLVTVTGHLMGPPEGEVLEMKGEWIFHPRYGEQFKVLEYRTSAPATVKGIQKYLGSGLIRGIGPIMASRIVKEFGEHTLDVIDEDIQRLRDVDGIGEKRIHMIRESWEEQKDIRELMVFLQSHGIGPGYATKIFRKYGRHSIQILRSNPYRPAMEIFGIGFLTADRIAEKLGMEKDSPLRAEAGILYVLNQLADEGHVYYPYEMLLAKCREVLDIGREILVKAFGSIAAEGKIVVEDLSRDVRDFEENHKAVYLARYHVSETGIAARIKALVQSKRSLREVEAGKALEWVQRRLAIRLADNQAKAVSGALKNKIMVITGGPGTGKTTIINAVLKILTGLKARVLLAAPTGRAAKRMSEATGWPAKTLHRLLEYSLQRGGFQRNERHPLVCDALIVDEASMIDTALMYHLVKALPTEAVFILVGDVNQLPSVGAGNVLKDIIASKAVPVVELTEIFRQAKQSQIVVNAHLINQGLFPVLDPSRGSEDFYFVEQEDPGEVLRIILELTQNRIPRRFALDPVDDIQVLAPMNKGVVGTWNLNAKLQEALNPGERHPLPGERDFRVSDKVMQIRNNYDKEVFNGDIGRILHMDGEKQEAVVTFDDRRVVYPFADLDELALAYAVSVHKSQGSEYPAVVLPLLTQHFVLLQRNLIYTAVTRAKRLVIIVGSKKALAIGIKNNKTQKRYTCLGLRLAPEGSGGLP